MNAQTGETIIPANRKIATTLIRKLAASYAHLDIGPSPIRNKICEIIGRFEAKCAELEMTEQREIAMETEPMRTTETR